MADNRRADKDPATAPDRFFPPEKPAASVVMPRVRAAAPAVEPAPADPERLQALLFTANGLAG